VGWGGGGGGGGGGRGGGCGGGGGVGGWVALCGWLFCFFVLLEPNAERFTLDEKREKNKSLGG